MPRSRRHCGRHGIDFTARLGRARRFRRDLDARSRCRPATSRAVCRDALLRNTFERYWTRVRRAPRQPARVEGLHAVRAAHRRQLRAPGLARPRAGRRSTSSSTDRQPPAWNQWAEVVSHTPRTPFFLGDLPHAWVESDYVRSVLDLFAYERAQDDALVLAAGVPSAWMDGRGRRDRGPAHAVRTARVHVAASRRGAELRVLRATLPPGGLVLPWPGDARPRGCA